MEAVSFNTQPPEGGWTDGEVFVRIGSGFNTQPPEGGWAFFRLKLYQFAVVSTHSRLKAAGLCKGVEA